MEPNSPPCRCLLILKELLDRRLPVLLMSSVSGHEHEREDVFPMLGKIITVDRVWTFPDPVPFCDDLKLETWTGIEHIAL